MGKSYNDRRKRDGDASSWEKKPKLKDLRQNRSKKSQKAFNNALKNRDVERLVDDDED